MPIHLYIFFPAILEEGHPSRSTLQFTMLLLSWLAWHLANSTQICKLRKAKVEEWHHKNCKVLQPRHREHHQAHKNTDLARKAQEVLETSATWMKGEIFIYTCLLN